jgi:hypothetical protein
MKCNQEPENKFKISYGWLWVLAIKFQCLVKVDNEAAFDVSLSPPFANLLCFGFGIGGGDAALANRSKV